MQQVLWNMKSQLKLKKPSLLWPKVHIYLKAYKPIFSKITWLHILYIEYILNSSLYYIFFVCYAGLSLLCVLDTSWHLLQYTSLNWIISCSEVNSIISLSSFLEKRYIYFYPIWIITASFSKYLTQSCQCACFSVPINFHTAFPSWTKATFQIETKLSLHACIIITLINTFKIYIFIKERGSAPKASIEEA